ncbi:MAG: DegT/DnrJ/EryC1/StrS family aminotransferase [Planctomycetota bacterium]|nr:DegT/DnrJ/EryC1/StrS family aminotransferase [Planctomycetota bacterium]MDW8372862.1 DegT/DnrJ/EryC1/StrS family aminotransferase [Planctomycetota bacterium]
MHAAAVTLRELVLAPDVVGRALRDPGSEAAALRREARAAGLRLWLACAAIADYRAQAPSPAAFAALAADCQWLNALPSDIDPSAEHPLRDALLRAAARLGPQARVVSEAGFPEALTPAAALRTPWSAPALPFCDLAAQQDRIRPELERRIDAVLRHGHYILGPEVAELEAALAERVGVAHAIACGSGTVSLEIALRALGVGPGDEVITVAFTWISTAETIAQVGATPVFVDIDPTTFCMDPQRVAAAITPRTRALVPVSLFGQPAAIERIAAAAPGIPIIEDAAQSFGATRHGRASGALALLGSTSFFPAKPLGCYGDGGCLFTADAALAERLRAIRNHGATARFQHPYLGLNGRMDTVQAAILLAKLTAWDDERERRRAHAARYDAALRSLVTVPAVDEGNTHVYAQYTVRHPQRDRFQQLLAQAGIPTAIYYPVGLHRQPPFAACPRPDGLPETERACREVISLPLFPDLPEAVPERVAAVARRLA